MKKRNKKTEEKEVTEENSANAAETQTAVAEQADNSEENPNKNLVKRLNDAEFQQVGLSSAAIGPLKEALGEEVCKKIMIDKSSEQIVNRPDKLLIHSI